MRGESEGEKGQGGGRKRKKRNHLTKRTGDVMLLQQGSGCKCVSAGLAHMHLDKLSMLVAMVHKCAASLDSNHRV